jgi:hypothetical protein
VVSYGFFRDSIRFIGESVGGLGRQEVRFSDGKNVDKLW